MRSVNPVYIVLFLIVIIVVTVFKISNPYREYSTQEFWENATVTDVAEVPAQALALGNKNGPVLMWAAIAAKDPDIIRALVERGARPNEKDPLLSGTPLTGAAAYNSNPEIIEALVKLGADVNQTVFFDDSPLIIAASYATNPAVITTLIKLGADPFHKNVRGDTALDFALREDNEAAIKVLSKYVDEADNKSEKAQTTETAGVTTN